MVNGIKVIINKASRKSEVIKEISDDFVIITPWFLNHLHRSWIKVSSKTNSLEVNGGFLVKCEPEKVYLRVPAKKEIYEIDISDDILFYVKNDDLNYIAMTELEVKKSKIDFLMNALKEKEDKLDKKIKSFEKMKATLKKA
jgi:hypothetical protein